MAALTLYVIGEDPIASYFKHNWKRFVNNYGWSLFDNIGQSLAGKSRPLDDPLSWNVWNYYVVMEELNFVWGVLDALNAEYDQKCSLVDLDPIEKFYKTLDAFFKETFRVEFEEFDADDLPLTNFFNGEGMRIPAFPDEDFTLSSENGVIKRPSELCKFFRRLYSEKATVVIEEQRSGSVEYEEGYRLSRYNPGKSLKDMAFLFKTELKETPDLIRGFTAGQTVSK